MPSEHNINNSEPPKTVQMRLLDAAENLFAQKGFDQTSIRELAAAANCNIASVNYYFGSKDNLYIQVWRWHMNQMVDARLAGIAKAVAENQGNPKLENLLRAFSYAFIEPLLDQPRANNLLKLMIRETQEQHLPANMFMDEVVSPTLTAMRSALLKTCPRLDSSMAVPIVFSLIGQLIQAVHIKAIFERVQNPDWPVYDLTQLVDHIVHFTAAGIRAYEREADE